MRETSALEKFMTSTINVVVVFILFLPFYFFDVGDLDKRFVLIGLWFFYNLMFLIYNDKRGVGMMVMKTRYARRYSMLHGFIYVVLYTLSFSTLFFWIYFPFDLFLFNILILQLPTVLIKKTTLHGYLSGKITTMTSVRKGHFCFEG